MKPILINNLEIAKNRDNITGEITADSCERLVDILDKNDSSVSKIHYNLIGSTTKFQLPSISLSIKAELPVICQRCLEAMKLEIAVTYDYVISNDEPVAFDDDDVDWLEASREMDLIALIEDELLMAVPLAPTHKHACQPVKLESGEKHNPFSVLKGLVK